MQIEAAKRRAADNRHSQRRHARALSFRPQDFDRAASVITPADSEAALAEKLKPKKDESELEEAGEE